jgi:hypothetical protein
MPAVLLEEAAVSLGIQRAEPYNVMDLEHALVLPQTKCAMVDLALAVSLEPESKASAVFVSYTSTLQYYLTLDRSNNPGVNT